MEDARGAGLVAEVPRPEQVAAGFPTSPAHDFGKFIQRVPGVILRPRTQAELDASVAILTARGVPFKLRGANHCSGGQTLIEGGAVIDTRGLRRIVEDRPDAGEIVVEAGATWLQICQALRPSRRAPPNLTMNWRTTVGGALMTGGFGDLSYRDGPQVTMVRGLELLTLDGQRHAVAPGDPLFDYTLAGRGQLGVVTKVTLEATPQVWSLAARAMAWPSIADYLCDLPLLFGERGCDVVRTRVSWTRGLVLGAVGRLSTDLTAAPDGRGLRARPAMAQLVDLYAAGIEGENAHWVPAVPALELVLPYAPDDPAATAARLEALRARVVEAGLATYTVLGSAIMSLPPASVAPHAPLAPLLEGPSHVVVLRPELPAERVARYLGAIEALGRWCYDQGGKLYLVGVEPPGLVDLSRQLGAALPTLLRLKRRWDPDGLLNPGLL